MLRCCVLYNKSFHFLRAVACEILGLGQTVQQASSKTVEYEGANAVSSQLKTDHKNIS